MFNSKADDMGDMSDLNKTEVDKNFLYDSSISENTVIVESLDDEDGETTILVTTSISKEEIGIPNFKETSKAVIDTLNSLYGIDHLLAEDPGLTKNLKYLLELTDYSIYSTYMLKLHVIGFFTDVIADSSDCGLIELLINIMAKLCYTSEGCEEITSKPKTIRLFLSLINIHSNVDTLIRLLNLVEHTLTHSDIEAARKWYKEICTYPNFVDNLADILINLSNKKLLCCVLDILNVSLNVFAMIYYPCEENSDEENDLPNFEDTFRSQKLVESVFVAYKSLMRKKDEHHKNEHETPENVEQIIESVINIHCIIIQFDQPSLSCYSHLENDLIELTRDILHFLANPLFLYPMGDFERTVVLGVCVIYSAINDVFDASVGIYIFNIWLRSAEYLQSSGDTIKSADNIKTCQRHRGKHSICPDIENLLKGKTSWKSEDSKSLENNEPENENQKTNDNETEDSSSSDNENCNSELDQTAEEISILTMNFLARVVPNASEENLIKMLNSLRLAHVQRFISDLTTHYILADHGLACIQRLESAIDHVNKIELEQINDGVAALITENDQ